MSDVIKFDASDIEVNGEKRYLEFFQATIGIGTAHWPYIKLVTHKKQDAEQKLMALTSADIAEDMQARQAVIFNERGDSDVSVKISVEDGNDNRFEFDGLVVGPSYSFSAHNVELADQAIPSYTKINFLNLSIYKDQANTVKNYDGAQLQIEKTICNMAKKQMEYWMANSASIFSQSPVKQYLEAQHKVNKNVKKYWEELLENSNSTFGWKDIQNYLKGNSDAGLRETLANIATQSAGTFSTVIDRFAEEFQCIYVPGWDNIGYFKSKKDLYANAKDLVVNPISLTINTSNGFGLLPTAYVGIESPDSIINTTEQAAQSKLFVCVPKENEGKGQMIRLLGPKWLSAQRIISNVKEDSEKKRRSGADVGTVEADNKATYEGVSAMQENISRGMIEYGECAYAYLSLADSKAEITMPINFKLKIGERYNVKNTDGKTLFEGLLAHVTHTLSTKSRSPLAHTTALFTHIEIGAFKLPGVSRGQNK